MPRPVRRDPLLESGPRLAICALLHGATWVEFATVRDATELTDSAVSKHSRRLEEAGYLTVHKGAVGRRARTWFELTANGRTALEGHLAWLGQITNTVPATEAAGGDGTEDTTTPPLPRFPRVAPSGG